MRIRAGLAERWVLDELIVRQGDHLIHAVMKRE
jgi:hypothetical protein